MADMVPFGDLFGDLGDMRRKLDRMFSAGMFQAGRMGKEMRGMWHPAIDVEETESSVIIKAELAGVDQNDINIEANESSLTLSGKREEHHEVENKKIGLVRRERSFGSFSRTIPLPSRVDPDQTEASFLNGVLTIHLLKIEKGKRSKKINIKPEE